MGSTERSIMIDANSLAYYRHFARLKDPTKMNAVEWIEDFAQKTPHDVLLVVAGSPTNWRHSVLPDYKSQRPPRPDEVRWQLDAMSRMNGFACIHDCEADDTVADLAASSRGPVIIVAADKDYHQIVSDRVVVYDPMRDFVFDTAAVVEKWKVPPSRMRALLALMGDKSDNIPGVPGIGAGRAAKVAGLMTWAAVDAALQERDVKAFESCGLTSAMADMIVTFRGTVTRNYELVGLGARKV